jgi:hypothetical protein
MHDLDRDVNESDVCGMFGDDSGAVFARIVSGDADTRNGEKYFQDKESGILPAEIC